MATISEVDPEPRDQSSVARVHPGLGDSDGALAWVTQAVNHNDEWIHPLTSYPFVDPIRDDPRFRVRLSKLGLEA